MEEYVLFIRSYVANVQGVYNLNFAGPNSAIISGSCGHIGTQICILVQLSFLSIFE